MPDKRRYLVDAKKKEKKWQIYVTSQPNASITFIETGTQMTRR
jgi:hypothetical protein